MKESDLQTKCNNYLKHLGIPFYHQEKGRFSSNRYHSNGFPDLIFMYKKKFYMFELKKEGGTVSDKQIATMKAWHEQGAIVALVFTFDGFLDQLKQYNIIPVGMYITEDDKYRYTFFQI